MAEFFAMGGRGAYVWSSFAAALVLIGAVVVYASRELSRVKRQIYSRALLRDSEKPGNGAAGVQP